MRSHRLFGRAERDLGFPNATLKSGWNKLRAEPAVKSIQPFRTDVNIGMATYRNRSVVSLVLNPDVSLVSRLRDRPLNDTQPSLFAEDPLKT